MKPVDETQMGDTVGDEKNLNANGDFVVPHEDATPNDTTPNDATPAETGPAAEVDAPTLENKNPEDGNTLKISHGDDNSDNTDKTTGSTPSSEPAPAPEPTPATPTNPFAPQSNETPTLRPNNPFATQANPTPQNNTPPVAGTESAAPTPPTPPTPPVSPAQPTPATPVNPFAPKPGEMPPTAAPNPTTSPFAQRPQFAAPQGDIILNTDQPPKKSKKPLAIIAVIASICVIISVAVFGILAAQKNGTQANLAGLFNQYANYLLYEENSNQTPAGEYSNAQQFAVNRKIQNGITDESTQFLNSAKDRLNTFTTAYNNNPQSDDITKTVQSYNDYFEFFYLYYTNTILTQKSVLEQYQKTDSLEQTSKYIEKAYTSFTKSSSTYAQQYGKDATTYWKSFIKTYRDAQAAGCIKANNIIDSTCYQEKIASTTSQNETPSNDFERLIDTAQQFILSNCWSISKQLEEQVS